MAEIHVEAKKHNNIPAWVWILITVVVVALVAFFLTRNNTTTDQNNMNKGSTSYVQPELAETGSAYFIKAA